jgi:hypothetical protein
MTTVVIPQKSQTEQNKRVATESEAVREYAAYRCNAGWCVDMSGQYATLMHGKSNRGATTQDIKLAFPGWASSMNLKVDSTNYPAFLAGLTDRVLSQLPRIYGRAMRPCSEEYILDESGLLLVNTYNPITHNDLQPIPAPFNQTANLFGQTVPSILAEMFERVFPVEAERKFMIQRLAAIIQAPEKRVKHGVFLTGAGGSGKSSVLDVLERALGGRHIDRTAIYSRAQGEFSEVFVNNLVVAFEDKAIGSGAENYVYTNLKQIIDYKFLNTKIKFSQRDVMREVYCNIFITTNNPNLFPWDEHERRFFAPQEVVHKTDAEESKQFFAGFHKFLELPETPALIYHWLKTVDMDGFDFGACVRTPYMDELIGKSGTMLDACIGDFLEGREIFHPKTIATHLAGQKAKYSDKDVERILRSMGFGLERMMFRSGEAQARTSVWRKNPGPNRRFRKVTPEEHEFILTEHGAVF